MRLYLTLVSCPDLLLARWSDRDMLVPFRSWEPHLRSRPLALPDL